MARMRRFTPVPCSGSGYMLADGQEDTSPKAWLRPSNKRAKSAEERKQARDQRGVIREAQRFRTAFDTLVRQYEQQVCGWRCT